MKTKNIENQKTTIDPELKDAIIEVYKDHIEPGINKKFDDFERRVDQRFYSLEQKFSQKFDDMEDLMIRRFDEMAIFIQRQVQEITGKIQLTDESVDTCETRLTRLEEKVA